MSHLADALAGKIRYHFGEFLAFVRFVPLVLSLVLVEGLMLRQLGEYFGVHNLVDYDRPSLQIGSGFGLMFVYLQCLYIGYLLVRAYRQDTETRFLEFAISIPAFSLIFVALFYGIGPSLSGLGQLLSHVWFCTGMAIALVLLVACQQLGEWAAKWILNRPGTTIVSQCEQLRQEPINHLDYYGGAAILLCYFVIMTLFITWIGAQRPTWVMYVFAVVFVAGFFFAAIRGPTWFREKVIRAFGAELILNRAAGVQLVFAWLFFLVAGETVVCFMSLSHVGGSPITTICALWVGSLACYLLFRNVAIRSPIAVIVVLGFLLVMGGINEHKYQFTGDLSYDSVVDLSDEAKLDHDRQAAFDARRADFLKANKKLALDPTRLDELLTHERVQLLNQNRVVAPRANWTEKEVSRPMSHGLLDIRDLAFRRYDSNANRSSEEKPIVLIAVSGGGLRSAAWTYCILQMLEDELAREGVDFASHVRLICGASGGMVGASYYVGNLASMEARESRLTFKKDGRSYVSSLSGARQFYENLTADFLTPVMNTLIFHDVPYMFAPWSPKTDRGIALQEEWMKVKGRENVNPFATTFAQLRGKERRGEVPSLAFTPMIVEDGRRLVISNLDFRWVATNGGHRLSTGGTHFSVEALELFRLFPQRQSAVRLATAARMSASFPYVSSPAVLPTTPRRRVVDAGYYDNYGVSLAASWLFSSSHQQVLAERKIKRVLLIQIRDGVSDPDRRLESVRKSRTNQVMRAAEEFTTPLTGFYNGQSSSSSFRNDGMLELLSQYAEAKKQQSHGSTTTVQKMTRPNRFMTLTLEYGGDASLSWYLSRSERDSIWTHSKIRQGNKLVDTELSRRVQKMKQWWFNYQATRFGKPPFPVLAQASVDELSVRQKTRMRAIGRSQYRRYNLSLAIPSPHNQNVKRVVYYMDHPSFSRRELVGDNRNGFRASYIGYGALSRVRIHIQMNDGEEYETEFNQRAALNRQTREENR